MEAASAPRAGGALERRHDRVLLAAWLALALVARVPGLSGDLWLDEVCTHLIAEQVRSPLEVLWGVHHSNNHYLYTLWFLALGDAPTWAYRLPSLVAGTAAVALAWRVACDVYGRLEGHVAALLCALCFPLVHFSSEARGYTLALALGLLGFAAARAWLARPRLGSALVVQLTVVLGVLAHLMFLQVLVSLAAWVAWRVARSEEGRGALLRRAATLALPPALVLAAFWWVEVRHVRVLPGPTHDLARLLTRSGSLVAGGPERGPLAVGAAALALAGIGAGLVALRRRGGDEWVFFLACVLLWPLLAMGVLQPHLLYLRYFLISIAFGLVAAAGPVAALLRRGGAARALAALALLALAAGSARHVLELARVGRGAYREALADLVARSPQQVARVASDRDFQNGILVDYYRRFLPPGAQVIYLPRGGTARREPDWLIRHSYDPARVPEPEYRDRHGRTFELERAVPFAGISGAQWFLYRNPRSVPPAEPRR